MEGGFDLDSAIEKAKLIIGSLGEEVYSVINVSIVPSAIVVKLNVQDSKESPLCYEKSVIMPIEYEKVPLKEFAENIGKYNKCVI